MTDYLDLAAEASFAIDGLQSSSVMRARRLAFRRTAGLSTA